MSRRRPLLPLLAAVVAVLLLVLFFLGIYLGAHPGVLPGFVRNPLVGDKQEQVLREGLAAIRDDYYRKIPEAQLVNRSLDGAVASLGDEFSQYFDPQSYARFQSMEQGTPFAGIGVAVAPDPRGLRVARVFDGSPAQRAGIVTGTLILAANGTSLARRPSSFATGLIRGKPGTSVELTLIIGRRRLTKRVERALMSSIVQSRTLQAGGRKLGYVALNQFASGAHAEVAKAVRREIAQGAKGIVFDLRGNGGGLLDEGVLVSSLFIPKGVIVSTQGRERPKHVYEAEGETVSATIPLVVLVDRGTASASEIVTGAIGDHHRGKIVGTNTFGKGVFQEVRDLPNGGALKITVGEYFTPNGRNLGGGGVKEGKGLNPDIRAMDDPKTLGRDEALVVAERTLAAEIR